jgi:hypothetical protein
MKYLKPKDLKHRIAFIQIEKKVYLLKAIINSSFLPKEVRFNARITLANIRKYGMPTKIRNRCLISSRGILLIVFLNLHVLNLIFMQVLDFFLVLENLLGNESL